MGTASETFRASVAATLAADMAAWSPLVAAFEGGRRYQQWEIEELAEREYPGCAVLNGVAHLVAGSAEAPVNLDVQLL
jgi:hypothetical protein